MIKCFKQKSVKFKTKIFAQSLTVVSHSLLQNHMEMLAMQAILSDTYIFWVSRNTQEPQITDEERIQAIATQYAVLTNKTSGRTAGIELYFPYFKLIIYLLYLLINNGKIRRKHA